MSLKSESDFNVIRGKMLVNHQSQEELFDFLATIAEMEAMLDESDEDDYFGTEGWRHRLGWD